MKRVKTISIIALTALVVVSGYFMPQVVLILQDKHLQETPELVLMEEVDLNLFPELTLLEKLELVSETTGSSGVGNVLTLESGKYMNEEKVARTAILEFSALLESMCGYSLIGTWIWDLEPDLTAKLLSFDDNSLFVWQVDYLSAPDLCLSIILDDETGTILGLTASGSMVADYVAELTGYYYDSHADLTDKFGNYLDIPEVWFYEIAYAYIADYLSLTYLSIDFLSPAVTMVSVDNKSGNELNSGVEVYEYDTGASANIYGDPDASYSVGPEFDSGDSFEVAVPGAESSEASAETASGAYQMPINYSPSDMELRINIFCESGIDRQSKSW